MVAAAKGYELVVTMPASMSMERRVLLKAFGAKVLLTPAGKGMGGAVAFADVVLENLKKEGKDAVILGQFTNGTNPKAHRETTGPEIWYQTDGKIDFLVGGVGTGGTLTGAGQFLKPLKADLKLIAVEPNESPILSGGKPGLHKIQGMGVGFVPPVCNTILFDEIMPISSADAVTTAQLLAKVEGVLCGISSGAIVRAALTVGNRPENKGKIIVAFIPSFGERYLSTVLFEDLTKEATEQQVDPLSINVVPVGEPY